MKKQNTVSKLLKEYGILLILLVTIVVFAIANQNFFTLSNAFTITRQVSLVGIAAVGVLVVLVLGLVDLSIGSMVSFVCVFGAYLMQSGVHPVIACIIVLVVAGVIGAVQGLIISKLKVPAFIVTLSFMNILSGCAYLLTSGKPIYGFSDHFSALGQGYVGIVPIPVIVMVLCFLLGWYIMNWSYFGRYFYALGGNEEAALLAGINVDLVKTCAFILSSIFGALSGLVLLSRIQTGNAGNGTGFEFDVIIACVLGGVSPSGGKGGIFNIVVGAMIIGVLNNGMIILGMSEYIQLVVKGTILVVAVSIDQLQKRRESMAV